MVNVLLQFLQTTLTIKYVSYTYVYAYILGFILI